MSLASLSYRDTGRFSPIVLDYLDQTPALQEHYTRPPTAQGLADAANARTFDPATRKALCSALESQYAGMRVQPEVRRNLDLLAKPNTLTVTTGHQLNLFTGPLYVPFKLLNVIKLARTLSTPEQTVVPVFWMATEDHDRAEIDHTYINGTKVEWPGEADGAVGRMRLDGIGEVLHTVDELLGTGSHADAMRVLLRDCYRPEYTWAEATRRFADALFGRFGLVILDADDAGLKKQFAPVMREELLNEVAVRSVEYANAKLAEHYKVQAHARPINLFHLRPGHRSRIELQGDHYQVLDGGPRFTLDELLNELDKHPENFSPNVLLRPVYQEVVLPNITYVGGGGELAYWLQLRWLFQAVQVPVPVLMLRTSAAFISAKNVERAKKLGLSIPELFKPAEALQAKTAKTQASFTTDIAAEQEAAKAFYAALAQRASAADPTLHGAVEAMAKRAQHGLERLEKKLLRAAKRQQQEPLEQLDRVLENLFPGGGLQERRENFMPWYTQEGPAFFDRLLEELDPLDARFKVLGE
jgi:bacillithiol biosynthesis cysteine-adding enzyme BshC